jgi:hypothetical protein
MAGAKFTVQGIVQLQQRLAAIAMKMPAEVGRALRTEMEIEATESKRRTPVKSGNLRGSIRVEGPEVAHRKISASLLAGGVSAPYAVFVHEDPDAFHPVGEYKFIESVLLESRPFMAERVARRIDLLRVR